MQKRNKKKSIFKENKTKKIIKQNEIRIRINFILYETLYLSFFIYFLSNRILIYKYIFFVCNNVVVHYHHHHHHHCNIGTKLMKEYLQNYIRIIKFVRRERKEMKKLKGNKILRV